MAYAFMTIAKVKSMGKLVSKYNHNYRKLEISNVDPELSHLNEDLVPLPKHEDGTEMRYDEAFKKRMETLPFYDTHRIRGDQVLGYEILLSYSRGAEIDVETWKQKNVEWLHKTFDVAPDGRSNVVSAVFHADETGNVHIHAFVVPVDERGHLNAKRFTNGSRAMTDLQSSYYESVKDLGLERGLAGSSAKHRTIRKMYADLNNAANIPQPLEGESAAEYMARIQEDAETMYLTRYRAGCDFQDSSRRHADEYRIRQVEAAKEEVEMTRTKYASEIKSLRQTKSHLEDSVAAAQAELSSYQAQMDELTAQMWKIRTTVTTIEEEHAGAVKAARIKVGLELIRQDDPERADRMENDIEEAIARATAREAREAEDTMTQANVMEEQELD